MAMEKLKKRFNTSPMIKKKSATLNGCPSTGTVRGDGNSSVHLKTFGASLEELAVRERCDVPLILRKICDYIKERGLNVEGLFRINGNVRLIQSLMTSYEAEGDVDLSGCNDVHSIAGLLKRFVRDLSDGLIPERLTGDFIKAVEVNGESEDACISAIRKLLDSLSQESYATLRYLCFFLWEVRQKEAENKMSAGSLGIVFGPNVFRCGENSMNLGLSMSYTHCNRAMSLMISHCNSIFDKPDNGDLVPRRSVPSSPKATPPPRPPPPVISSQTESPRLLLHWGRSTSDEPVSTARSASPFLQDNSETECSLTSRDLTTGPPAPTVSNVIHHVVSDSMFGDNDKDSELTPSPKPRKPRERGKSTPAFESNGIAELNEDSVPARRRPDNCADWDQAPGPAPAVAPRRARRPDSAAAPQAGRSATPEINNNLQGSHSLPELKFIANDAHTPSDGDQSLGEVTARINYESEEDRSLATVPGLRRQIKSLKRRVRQFEDDFLQAHGYKPSVREKRADQQMRACLSDLAVYRRRLRAMQDGPAHEMRPLNAGLRSRSVEQMASASPGPRSRTPKPQARADRVDGGGGGGGGAREAPRNKLEQALDELEHELQVKRELSGRPEPIHQMTWDQIRDEKITLQRGLLNHESKYGRPRTVEEKEVMRPVYDRYRTVKRVLSGARRMDMTESMVQPTLGASNPSLDEIPTASGDLFAVTQDFQSRMRREGLMTTSLIHNPTGAGHAPPVQRRINLGKAGARNRDKRRSQPVMPSESLSHDPSIEHLREEESRLRGEKKQLQRMLKQYERKFEQETGRRLERADRQPMQNEYIRYKNIKIKLKDLTNAIAMNS